MFHDVQAKRRIERFSGNVKYTLEKSTSSSQKWRKMEVWNDDLPFQLGDV